VTEDHLDCAMTHLENDFDFPKPEILFYGQLRLLRVAAKSKTLSMSAGYSNRKKNAIFDIVTKALIHLTLNNKHSEVNIC
jgi:hypothetical protein